MTPMPSLAVPAPEPAESGPTLSAPPSSRRAMLPPPALTVSIRIEGSASGTPATAPVPLCTAVPPVTRLASALVPPISSVSSSDSPTAAPTSCAPTTPPAGPDNASAAARPAAARGARGDAPDSRGVAAGPRPPRRPHALGEAHTLRPGNQGRGMIACQVVERGPVLSPEPEQVLEAARRHQDHPRPAPLEQRVGRDRRAVHQELHGGRQQLDRPEHRHRRILRRRGYLADGDRAVGRDGDQVGEGAADVDPHPRHSPSLLRIADCGLRIGKVRSCGTEPTLTIRNPKSAIRNFTAGAPRSTVAPQAPRRTPRWPAPPTLPPSRRAARRACARRS